MRKKTKIKQWFHDSRMKNFRNWWVLEKSLKFHPLLAHPSNVLLDCSRAAWMRLRIIALQSSGPAKRFWRTEWVSRKMRKVMEVERRMRERAGVCGVYGRETGATETNTYILGRTCCVENTFLVISRFTRPPVVAIWSQNLLKSSQCSSNNIAKFSVFYNKMFHWENGVMRNTQMSSSCEIQCF